METRINPTPEACKKLLLEANINPASTIEYEINGVLHTVTLTWIMEAFMQGADETKRLFYSSLKKIAESGNRLAMKEYFENMGKLILLSSLSEKSGEFQA